MVVDADRCLGGVRCASVPAKTCMFTFFFFSCVFDRRRAADKRSRSRSPSKTHSQLNMWQVDLQREKSGMQTIDKILLNFSPTHLISCSLPQTTHTVICLPFSTVTLADTLDILHKKVVLCGSLSKKPVRVIL